MTKYLRPVLAAVLAVILATTAFAQAETVTLGDITLDLPTGYIVDELAPSTYAVSDAADEYGVILLTGDAVELFGFAAGTTPADVMLLSDDTIGTVTGTPEAVSLPSGDGFYAEASFADLGNGFIVAVEGEYGLLVAFVAGEYPSGFEQTALEIIGSVVIDSVAAPEPTATPDKGETPVETPTEVDPVALGEIDGETCPIPVEALPEQTVVFCPGVVVTLPDGWAISEGTVEVDNFAPINRDEFTVSLSTLVMEISPFYNPDTYIRDTLTILADINGHTTFDPAEHVKTLVEEDGRTVLYYDAADYVEPADDAAMVMRQATYIVILNNDLFVTHTFTWFPSFAGEGVEDEISAIAEATVLADFYDGAPALMELDGETVFIHEATGTESTYSFRFNAEETFVVSCPASAEEYGGIVWGTEVYTSDSSICSAAVHAGVITQADGGLVLVTMLPGQDSYVGSTANGITTIDYAAWDESFTVSALE